MNIKRKAIISTIIGNALEYYDVTLYGFFAALLAPIFFPSSNLSISLIASLGTFAAGFLMRPLGGAIFGHIGDKWGRKNALVLSIFFITIPTFVIGILPSYEKIGFLAPIILVVCRLMQGFCAGGEYCGAAVFIAENTEKGKEGFASSLLGLSGFLGAAMGTMLGALCTSSHMPEWGWRIPFVLGAFFGLFGFYIRYHTDESYTFKTIKNEGKIIKFPIVELLKQDKINLICTFGLAAAGSIPFYIVTIYANIILVHHHNIALSETMKFSTLIMILWILILPIMGIISDKIGKRKLMRLSSLLTIFIAMPLSAYVFSHFSLQNVLIMQFVVSLISAAFVAPISTFVPALFKTNRRYSGIGVSYNAGSALLGGTTPLVISTIVNWTGKTSFASVYMLIGGLIGWVSLKNAKKVSEYYDERDDDSV